MYCATIGFFDGVHLGHQFVLRQLWSEAERSGLQPAIITFQEHPAKELRGEEVPLLCTPKERMAMLQKFGAKQIFCFRFEAIRDMSAEEFLGILKTQCHVDMLLMGYDQRFGSDYQQDFQHYEVAGMRQGVRVVRLPEAPDFTANEGGLSFLTAQGEPMPAPSSSVIRQLIAEGDVSSANFLLGRPYALDGLVVEGKQVGRKIGFPTANLLLQPGILTPAPGVYVCEVSFPASRMPAPFERKRAILNVSSEGLPEVHIPDFEGNLYNRRMTVCPLRWIRGEQQFDSLDQLRDQIKEDIKNL